MYTKKTVIKIKNVNLQIQNNRKILVDFVDYCCKVEIESNKMLLRIA